MICWKNKSFLLLIESNLYKLRAKKTNALVRKEKKWVITCCEN